MRSWPRRGRWHDDTGDIYSTSDQAQVAPVKAGQFSAFGDFTAAQLAGLFEAVEEDLKRLPLWERTAKRYYIRGTRNRLEAGVAERDPRCVALNAHLRILPDGRVPTCQFNTNSVGSLREQGFYELWVSESARRQRDCVGRCPSCRAEGEILPSAVYGGDIMRHVLSRPPGCDSSGRSPADDTSESARKRAQPT